MRIWITAVVIALSLPTSVLGQATANAPAPRIRISGRLLDSDGALISNGGVALYLYGTGQLVDARAPDKDGRFVLTCQFFKKYELTAFVRGLDIVPPKFINVAGADMDIGDVRLSPTPDPPVSHPYLDLKGDLKPEQIIIDPKGEVHDLREVIVPIPKKYPNALEIRGCSSLSRATHANTVDSCRSPDINVEQFVGGKVKEIRVIKFWRFPTTTLADIREEVRRAWLGKFCCPNGEIVPSEKHFWNVEASVEFADGKHTSILMDGTVNVQVEGRDGRFWFLRLTTFVESPIDWY